MLIANMLSSLLLAGPAAAQEACANAKQTARDNCASTIENAKTSSTPLLSSDALGFSSALQSTAAQGQADVLKQAIEACRSELKSCQQTCGTSGGPGTNGVPAQTLALSADIHPEWPDCAPNQHHLMHSEDLYSDTYYENNPGEKCNSPLVLQLPAPGRAVAALELSSRLEGVLFDILGLRSTPTAFTKKQISWFLPTARQSNYFLVLPDANGRVLGIDQLFGNNTLGPDRHFAANGFRALAKYDGRRADGSVDLDAVNGFIDGDDAIFGRLRLWSDDDGDGVADPAELYTLKELNVKNIDLKYDPDYWELDEHGNAIFTKSVVTTEDGDTHVIFDLWFATET